MGKKIIDQKVLFPELEAYFFQRELEEMRPIWEDNQRKEREYRAKRVREQRVKILKFLGDKCVRCGFSDPRALQIDHIKGGGAKENRKYGPSLYKKYLERNCEGLQLLCANCNMIKKYEENEFPYKNKE